MDIKRERVLILKPQGTVMEEIRETAENATVYVLDSHGTGNHPHSTVFIIDEKDGIMEFSKLG